VSDPRGAPGRTGRTVVSITPLAIERDSRTFKQAVSIARLGHRSIVLEGERSEAPPAGQPFELISLPDAPAAWRNDPAPSADEDGGEAAASAGRLDALRHRAGVVRWRAGKLVRDLRPNMKVGRSLPDADLNILHSYEFSAAIMWSRRRYRTPYIYDAHDLYFAARPEHDRELPVEARLMSSLERRSAIGAGGLITPSRGCAEALAGRFGRRPEVIRNCHDPRLDELEGDDVRATLGLTSEDFLVVAVGNAKAGMAFSQIREALQRSPDRVHIAFVGRGLDRHAAEVSEHRLGDRIHLLGPEPMTRIVPFTRTADAALVPYVPLALGYERALPNRLFQALAAGLPVIFPAELPEIAEIVDRHEAGLPVSFSEPTQIAAALTRLVEDSELRAMLAANSARAGAEESWEHEEERFGSVVAAALASRPAPSRR